MSSSSIPDDLPLAVRRTRRCSTAPHSNKAGDSSPRIEPPSKYAASARPIGLSTPSRGRKKRVRFSDPGPSVADGDEDASTGLTPFMRRTKLAPGSASSSSKRRRHSGPAAAAAVNHPHIFDTSTSTSTTTTTPYSGEVTFLPLRQVLDGRVKRRIRRNGLSEEFNVISAEKRRRAQQAKAEMDSLRAAVASKDAEIRRLSGITEVGSSDGGDEEHDGSSIEELKKQVDQLRQALKSPAPSLATLDCGSSDCTQVDWTLAEGDAFTGGHDASMEVDIDEENDHEFGDESLAELACSTPSRRASRPKTSFPTPPSSTSPALEPVTPFYKQLITPPSDQTSRTVVADAEKHELEEELASLHLEVEKLTSTLEAYEAMTARISDKLSPFCPENGSAAEAILASRSPAVKVEAQLNNLLQAFSERRATLSDVDSSLAKLGFPGSSTSEIVASLSAAFRSARLELEYLSPGEITLPLTSAGAAVLDLLLSRLRELSRQGLEGRDEADASREIEISLRQQLSARVDAMGDMSREIRTRTEAMDNMKREIGSLKGKTRAKDARIRELEAGLERLRGAAKSYTRDIAELEVLARRLEGDLDAANKSLASAAECSRADLEEWSGIVEDKDAAVALLEDKLGGALAQTSALGDQLVALRAGHEAEVRGLRAEVQRVTAALRLAQETVQKLRAEKGVLGDRLDREKGRARAVVEAMRHELERVVQVGMDMVASPPRTPPMEEEEEVERLPCE